MSDRERPRNDSVAAALDQVGDRWTLLVLRECFFGVKRFVEFQRNLGVARNILSDRLGKLLEHSILERRRYCEHPPREEYLLTEKGRDLYAVTFALMSWADRWVVVRPALILTHATDGGTVEQSLRCSLCGERLTAHAVAYRRSLDEIADR